MSPSREAIELLAESRPIFIERRRAGRFWKRFGAPLAAVLLVVFYFVTTGRV